MPATCWWLTYVIEEDTAIMLASVEKYLNEGEVSKVILVLARMTNFVVG
ncbi:MAG: hypothetical protein RBT01_12465 [Anaerolineaceae bacterium]|jgi:hypothetical protein|nr:hypothetical protein [Anaerolineaceae bacterium]